MLLNYFKYHNIPKLPGFQTIDPPRNNGTGLRLTCGGYEVEVTVEVERGEPVFQGVVRMDNYNLALFDREFISPDRRWGRDKVLLWSGILETKNTRDGLVEAYTKAYAAPFLALRQKLMKGCGPRAPYDQSTWLEGANYTTKRLDTIRLHVGFTVWGCPLLAGIDPRRSDFYVRGRTHEGEIIEERFDTPSLSLQAVQRMFRDHRMEGQL